MRRDTDFVRTVTIFLAKESIVQVKVWILFLSRENVYNTRGQNSNISNISLKQ